MAITFSTDKTEVATSLSIEEHASLYLVGSALAKLAEDEDKDKNPTGLKGDTRPYLLDAVNPQKGNPESIIVALKYNKGAILDLVRDNLSAITGKARITYVAPDDAVVLKSVKELREMVANNLLPKVYFDLITQTKKAKPYPKVTKR